MVKCKYVDTRIGCRLGAACTYEHSACKTVSLSHTFTVHPDDHCETPAAAYDDILPVLHWLAAVKRKPASELRIYDPYFCAGSVVEKLAERGFPNVYNRNEDFYKVQSTGSCPDFDVLLTNPPYSDDHIEKCLRFCCQCNRPWFLLIPNYVYVNPYYERVITDSGSRPLYLTPPQRYHYFVPGGIRSEREKKTSPFLSFWYLDLGQQSALFIRWWASQSQRSELQLASHRSRIPHRMRAQYDPTRRRLRKKQREATERRQRRLVHGSDKQGKRKKRGRAGKR